MTRIKLDGTPDRRFRKTGPRPDLWHTGPDPETRRLRYKFLRARVQARYWCQDWDITWAEYQELMAGASADHGRGLEQLNLARKDRTQGWHMDNVHFKPRKDIVRRPKLKDAEGREIRRQRRNPR